MKFNPRVSSSRRTCRRAHFNADDAKRRMLMSAGLSKELREKYVFKSFPVVKGDEVYVLKGDLKGKTGKIIKVSRSKYRIFLDISYIEKKNGQIARFGLRAPSVMITKFCMDFDRNRLLEKKKKARLETDARKAPAEEAKQQA